jgi:peptidoglycan/LPS O-acetylase OafA/YrhL
MQGARVRSEKDGPALTDARSGAHSPGVRRPPNLKALTSVRYLAALHVALYHLVRPFSRWGVFAAAMGAGYTGVSFFFVLSGFILTYSHAAEYESGKGEARKFWVARLARLYPVYLLSLLLACWVERAQFSNPIHLLALAADLVMLQSWSTRMVNFFNVPAWSLSVEAFFYVVFPFVMLRLRPRSGRRAMVAFTGFWALAMVLPLWCVLRYPAASWSENGVVVPGVHLAFAVRRIPVFALPEFLSGISLGWLFVRFRPARATASLLAWMGAAGLAAALFFADRMPYVMLHNGLLLPLFAMLIVGLGEENVLSRLLSHPLGIVLGEASYSLYLIHFVLNTWLVQRFGVPETIAWGIAKVGVFTGLAVLLHIFVERPGRRRILAWWSARHPRELVLSDGPHGGSA